jgi:two-component system sensor histidine kinase CpxA
MKLRSMYTKTLVSFLVVVVITEILVFFLFIMIPARHFTARFDQFAKAKVQVVKEIVEDKVRSVPHEHWSENGSLQDFISDFSKLLGAPVWVTREDGSVALKSFSGEIPDLPETTRKEGRVRRGLPGIKPLRDFDFYTTVPLEPSGTRVGTIHILFNRPAASPPKGLFALGLLIIGIIVALFAIPVSRLITRRIKNLRQSASLIAQGNLSHRTAVKGKDEISELAQTFNDMTDKLEDMIVSGKELMANVSHELRTPLTRIRMAEELLGKRIAQGNIDELRGLLEGIREDIGELDGLIERMLDLSRLEMSQSPFRPEAIDPSGVIKELLDKLHPIIERKGLHLTTDLSYNPPFHADNESLHLALVNVLDNATKYTPEEGKISVQMSWKPDVLEIYVSNTCEALSQEDLSRIFDPFHRLKRSSIPGSGLGLAITKKAVERHHGTIEALNKEHGLEIRITLPRNQGASIN